MRYFFFVIIVILLAVAITNVYTVKQQMSYIIERLGKYNKIVGPGLHIKIPVLDRIAAKINLRTHQLEFSIDAKTKDNVTINMDVAAQYRVNTTEGEQGIYKSYYALQNPIDQMRAYLTDALRSAVPRYTLDEVFEIKDDIAADVNETVAGQMENYGYTVASTLITSIGLPKDVEASMNKINSAQREKEAAQSLAEAERIKVVTEAKANAEAMEEAGRGIAAQRKAIADGIAASLDTIQSSGVSAKEANELFLFTQWTDMMEKFARNGQSSTVILPSNFKETASMFEQLVSAEAVKDTESISE